MIFHDLGFMDCVQWSVKPNQALEAIEAVKALKALKTLKALGLLDKQAINSAVSFEFHSYNLLILQICERTNSDVFEQIPEKFITKEEVQKSEEKEGYRVAITFKASP